MSETSSGEIKQAIDLLHSAEYCYDKYESDLSMIDNGHARCKHLRRVDYARGVEPIPTWVNRDAVDDELGQHVGDAGVGR